MLRSITNKILVVTLVCFVTVATGICWWYLVGKLVVVTLLCSFGLASIPSYPVEKGASYFTPSYFREYDTGGEHWKYGFQEGLGEVEINGKWGFINSTGQIVIQPKFDEVLGFHEGIGMARSGAIFNIREEDGFGLTGRWKYIDKKGSVIIDNPTGSYFSEGLAPVIIPGKWKIHLWEGTFSGERGKCGYINKNGEMVIPAKYNFVASFSEGLAAVEYLNGKWGYINASGETVIEPRYDSAGNFLDGLAVVSINDKFGFINKQGDVTLLPYDDVSEYREKLASVEKDGKWGYIDKDKHLVIPLKFDEAEPFSDGYAAVIVEEKIGYINTDGGYVIEPKFEHFHYWRYWHGRCLAPFVSSFSEGLAAVAVGRKWGYIDKKGNFVIEPKFDLASPFTEGFAKVAVGDKLGYIDKQGKYIWEPTR